MQDLLSDLADFSRLQGTLEIQSQTTMHGNSHAAWVRSLVGEGRFAVRESVITGIDIEKNLRNLSRTLLSRPIKDEQTQLTEMAGSWKIVHGIVQNDDLYVESPTISASGSGAINIITQTLDYRANVRSPMLATKHSISLADRGIAVPIRISGRWDDISVRPDFSAMNPQLLRLLGDNPEKTRKAITEGITNVVRGTQETIQEELDAALEQFLPNLEKRSAKNKETATEASESSAPAPLQLLKKLRGN